MEGKSFSIFHGLPDVKSNDRRLPEQLVAGFRATLEEVVEAPKRCRPSRDDFKLQPVW